MMKKRLLILCLATGFLLIVSLIMNGLLWFPSSKITTRHIAFAEKLSDLHFTQRERRQMLEDLNDNRDAYQKMRQTPLPNAVPPALIFKPAGFLPRMW